MTTSLDNEQQTQDSPHGPVLFRSVSTPEEAFGGMGCGAALLFIFGVPLLFMLTVVAMATTKPGDTVYIFGLLAIAGLGTAFALWVLVDAVRTWRTPTEIICATSTGLRVWSQRPPRRSIFLPWNQIVGIEARRSAIGGRIKGDAHNSGIELNLSPAWPSSVSPYRYFEVDDTASVVLSADHGTMRGAELLGKLRTSHERYQSK